MVKHSSSFFLILGPGRRKAWNVSVTCKAINQAARAHVEKTGCGVLHRPQFTWTDLSLFRYDGIHLSVAGNRAFCQDLTNCIEGLVSI